MVAALQNHADAETVADGERLKGHYERKNDHTDCNGETEINLEKGVEGRKKGNRQVCRNLVQKSSNLG